MTRGDTLLLPAAGHCVPMPVLSLRVAPPARPVGALPRLRHALAEPGLGLDVAPGAEEAVAAALAETADERAAGAFVACRLPPTRSEAVLRARVLEAGRRLRRPVLDLVLLAADAAATPGPELVASWRTLLRLRDEGRIRALGTVEADSARLALLMDSTGEAPAVNDVETHPYRSRGVLRAFHAQHGIATRALAPLAPGSGLLHDPVVHGVALAVGASPGQVLLAWQWAHGDAAVTTAERPARVAEHAASLRVALGVGHLAALDALDRGERDHAEPRARDLRDRPTRLVRTGPAGRLAPGETRADPRTGPRAEPAEGRDAGSRSERGGTWRRLLTSR